MPSRIAKTLPTDSAKRASRKKPARLAESAPANDKKARPMARTGRKPRPAHTVDADWVQARLKQLHRTQAQLADAWGAKSASAVSRALRQNRVVTLDEFATLCEFLQSSPSELLPRLGYDIADVEHQVTIAGAVNHLAQVTHVTKNAGEQLTLPRPGTSTRALVIRASRGALSPYDGATVLYEHRDDPGAVPVVGRLAVIEIEGEVAPVLGVLSRGSRRDTVQVTRFGSLESADVEHVLHTYPVTQIIM